MPSNKALHHWRELYKIRSASDGYRLDLDMAHRPFPKVVQVQTINACNASCVMCPYGKTEASRKAGRMDAALWEKIIDEIANHPEVETFIPMLQNEPFLDSQILAKVKDFKRRCRGRVQVELVTHGGLLTPEIAEMLGESGLDILSISVDSIKPETYERIRIGLNHQEVMTNIQRVIDQSLPIKILIRMVRQTANQNEVKDFVKFWKSRGIETMIWDVGNRAGAVPDFEGLRVQETRAPWYAFVSDTVLRQFAPHCPVPFYMASVLHNGNVLVCGFDWRHESIIGNVREHTIAELWNSDEMRRVRRLHFTGEAHQIGICRQCSVWQKFWADQPSKATEGDTP